MAALRPGKLLLAVVTLAMAWVLVACSGEAAEPADLLLLPDDFDDIAVTSAGPQSSPAATGHPSAQVELQGADFALTESIIMFEDADAARATLKVIKQDQLQHGVTAPEDTGGFDDLSGILSEGSGGGETLTRFFVEGKALLRMSLSGAQRQELLSVYSELAREKVARQ